MGKSSHYQKGDHIAGNCYDYFHESGIFIHKYGPHCFKTNHDEVIAYLSNYTDWIDGEYIVKSYYNGELYPFPLNKTSIEKFFKTSFSSEEEIKNYISKKALPIINPKKSEELILSRIGKELYEAFYKGYTTKQWEMEPKDLDPSVCGRIPIRFNNFEHYTDDKFQKMPELGFTEMLGKMINHPNITVKLNSDFNLMKDQLSNKQIKIITGPVDSYFNYRLGHLGWRSLNFKYQKFDQEFVQQSLQVNYPNDYSYTRSVEYKHITKQISPHTLIAYEYPSALGDPYYPIPNTKNNSMFAEYKKLAVDAESEQSTYFCGRLAEYTYINTDQAVLKGLNLAKRIINDKR